MFKNDEKVSHNFGPVIPADPLIHLEGVNVQFGYFMLQRIDEEWDSELLGVLNWLCLEDVLAQFGCLEE